MKVNRILSLAVYLFLTACTALLPQTSEPGDVVESQPGAGGVVVQEVSGESYTIEGDAELGTVEIVGGDEEALREFLVHWMNPPSPGQAADHITVYLGSLPPEMPYSIPMPEQARLIASVRQTRFEVFQLILDVPLPVDEVRVFFDEALTAAGWRSASESGHGGGFVSSDYGQMYCLGEEKNLHLITVALENGLTNVRVYVQASEGYSPCLAGEDYSMAPWEKLIPVLKAPPGVSTSGGGGGSSSEGEAYNEAQLRGEISAADLAAYYNEQLLAAGWMELERGGEESTGWSYWSLMDEKGEEWNGTLIVTKVPPDSDKIFAYIRVSRIPK